MFNTEHFNEDKLDSDATARVQLAAHRFADELSDNLGCINAQPTDEERNRGYEISADGSILFSPEHASSMVPELEVNDGMPKLSPLIGSVDMPALSTLKGQKRDGHSTYTITADGSIVSSKDDMPALSKLQGQKREGQSTYTITANGSIVSQSEIDTAGSSDKIMKGVTGPADAKAPKGQGEANSTQGAIEELSDKKQAGKDQFMQRVTEPANANPPPQGQGEANTIGGAAREARQGEHQSDRPLKNLDAKDMAEFEKKWQKAIEKQEALKSKLPLKTKLPIKLSR